MSSSRIEQIIEEIEDYIDTCKGPLFSSGDKIVVERERMEELLRELRLKTPEEIKRSGFDTYFVDHTTGIYPIAASGQPFTASFFQSTGDVITDLTEDLAAEQKARTTYDNILRLADDYDVRDAIRFLRQRELVHFQRFGEALRITQDKLNAKNFYACNPAFDKGCGRK